MLTIPRPPIKPKTTPPSLLSLISANAMVDLQVVVHMFSMTSVSTFRHASINARCAL